MIRHFLTEVKYLQLLQHPNIVKILGSDTNVRLPVTIPPVANVSSNSLSEGIFE